MKAQLARPHTRGIDTVVPITTDHAVFFVQSRVDFVVRYLHGRYAITEGEMQTILCAGLGLMLVTPSRTQGWAANEAMGKRDGILAVERLEELAVPKSTTVWLDLEGCVSDAKYTSEWVTAWSVEVVRAGYEAGIYVGAEPGSMGSDDLWKLPYTTRYWRSGSRVPEPSRRSWCMQQLRPLDVSFGPTHVDHNVIEQDYLGDLPTWIVAS